ncbi:MAG: branched-chain amino acid ABC transporter permease [Acholeplasmataceae bacterium]
MKRTVKERLDTYVKHPYFGILLTAAVLYLLQVLGIAGLIRPSTINLIAPVIIYYIVALGFTLLLGYAGLASLGTAGFIGLSAYVLGYFAGTLGLPTVLGIILGLVLSITLGGIVGFISLRIQGIYLAIITLGISEILVEIFRKFDDVTGGQAGFSLFRLDFLVWEFKQTDRFTVSFYLIILVLVLVMVGIVNIIDSPTGRAMLAMKNSTSAAQAMGISVLKYRLLAFIIATVLAGLGGTLYFMNKLVLHPSTWGLALSLNILAAVVIGGTKSIYGVLAGAFIVFGMNDLVFKRIPFFDEYSSAYLILNGILIILVVMFYPGGIVRLFKDIRRAIRNGYRFITKKWKEHRYGKEA